MPKSELRNLHDVRNTDQHLHRFKDVMQPAPENFVHILSEAQKSSSCHQKAVRHRTAPMGMQKAKDASDTCSTLQDCDGSAKVLDP